MKLGEKMICDKCGKNKATSYKKITENGQDVFLHLCEKCKNLDNTAKFKTIKIGQKFENANSKNVSAKAKVCPICFSTFDSIIKSGKFGCSKCYEIFEEDFNNSILYVQDGAKHFGKRGRL